MYPTLSLDALSLVSRDRKVAVEKTKTRARWRRSAQRLGRQAETTSVRLVSQRWYTHWRHRWPSLVRGGKSCSPGCPLRLRTAASRPIKGEATLRPGRQAAGTRSRCGGGAAFTCTDGALCVYNTDSVDLIRMLVNLTSLGHDHSRCGAASDGGCQCSSECSTRPPHYLSRGCASPSGAAGPPARGGGF
jgi:hypothetical protein